MMKNNFCITTSLLCLHFNFPRFSFLYTIPLLLRFKIFDFLITPFYSTFMMSIFQLIRSIRAKNVVVFRMIVALNKFFSEIARVWMLHLYSEIPPYSGYFTLGVCEIIRLNLNQIYLKR